MFEITCPRQNYCVYNRDVRLIFFTQSSSRRVEHHGRRLRQQRRQTETGRHVGPVGASGLLREDAGGPGEPRGAVVPL